MARLLLVRHAETDLHSTRAFVGHRDVELNGAGRDQVKKLAQRLAKEKLDYIYTSDLKRAWATASGIALKHEMGVTVAPELREMDYGRVDGMTFDDIKRLYPELAEQSAAWSMKLQFPGGESVEQLIERVGRFLERIRQYNEKETVLVVSHGGPLRFMVCSLLGLDMRHWRQMRIDLASLSIVDTYPEICIMSLLNDTSHLVK